MVLLGRGVQIKEGNSEQAGCDKCNQRNAN
jgi:hypothetical protein